MDVRSRVAAALAAGLVVAACLTSGAQAAPRATVVYSSTGDLPAAFAVSHGSISFFFCGGVYEVPADGGQGTIPGRGCDLPYEPNGGVAYSPDGLSRVKATTFHPPVGRGYSRDTYSDVTVDGAVHLFRGYSLGPGYTPDKVNTYGTTSTSACVRDALGTDASYVGQGVATPAAVAAGPDRWYMVDRTANTVFRLDDANQLGVLAVLPPARVKVSAALASTLGWPSCVVGTTVAFEAAPNDIELAPDGTIYVAGLPVLRSGKHLDRSVIYKIDPSSGKIRTLPQHFAGPVDLAVGTRGRLFVARPAAGKISLIKKGRSRTYVKLPAVLSVETDENGHLYAAQGARPDLAQEARVVRLG